MTKLPYQEQQSQQKQQQQQQQKQQQQQLTSRPSISSSNGTSNINKNSLTNTAAATATAAPTVNNNNVSSSSSSGVVANASNSTSNTSTAAVVKAKSNGVESAGAPFYVASVPSLASSSTGSASRSTAAARDVTTAVVQQRSTTTNGRVSASSEEATAAVTKQDPDRQDSDHDPYKSGDELELTQDLNDTKDETTDDDEGDGGDPRRRGSARRVGGSSRSCEPTGADDSGSYHHNTDRSEDELDRSSSQKIELDGACLSESGDSLPGTPEKTYGLVGDSSPRRRRELLLDQSNQDTEAGSGPPPPTATPRGKLPLTATSSGASTSSRKSGGSSGGGGGGGSVPEELGKRPPFYGSPPDALLTDTSMISMVEFDPAHREMAVDVPESFIARTKTPPRYPPPKSSVTPRYHNNNNSSTSKKRGSGDSSGSCTPINGTLPYSSGDQGTLTATGHVLVQSPNSQEEENRIKKYEDELRLRREREEEAAMLRGSLRSSQKLQSLASALPPVPLQGLDNEAYTHEEQIAAIAQQTVATAAASTPSPRINELVESLQRIQSVLQSNGHRINEDVTLVAQLLSNPEFQKVLAVHNAVQQSWCVNRPPTPVHQQAHHLVAQVLQLVQSSSSPDAGELVELLSQYSVEGLLYAHDRVAATEPAPASAKILPGEASLDHQEDVQHPSVRIVRIDKTNEPLGATIRNEGDSVVIGRIVKGGAAEKSGKLHEGDEILEVNGVEVRSKSVNDVCDMLAGMTGTLTFIINPCGEAVEPPRPPAPPQTVHVKAHFDYDPEEDVYIPCRELGMSFQKGDILHVISQADPSWWQAYREGEEDQTLAGLIPSRAFQQQREAMRQTVVGDTNSKEKSKKGKQLLCAKKHQKKKKKKMLYSNYNDDFDNEEILTYEEVALYYPRANCKRPVVLIAPPNIGRHELRQKLMEDRERFAAAIPHTSRPRRDKEVDGADYHFISRAQFEEDILQRKFVEHGEFEKAYYGTSLVAIRTIVSLGQICVLNLHALSLKILKNSDLKPFVVFIAPPNLEKLRQKKQKMGELVKDEELKETMEKAREMEDQYGHYFDLIIINQDLESSYQQLLHEINMLEREPQWVPATWLMGE